MTRSQIEARLAALNEDIQRLREEHERAPADERAAINAQIERLESEFRDLEVDQRNRASMDGGSEA